MKISNKIMVFVIASITVIGNTINNNQVKKLLVENVEALTDLYEDKKDVNGNTLTVCTISKELTKEEKDALKGELYYITHGLPNPYHWMHVGSQSAYTNTFYNKTKKRWETLNKCTDTKALCTGERLGNCWAINYPFFGS